MKILKCNTCGNIILFLEDRGIIPQCCGKPMNVIEPNTMDTGTEKHLPKVECTKNCFDDPVYYVKIRIGEVDHPMSEEHYIQWIILETEKSVYIRFLTPLDRPQAKFILGGDEKPIKAYEYCSVHGLWEKDL